MRNYDESVKMNHNQNWLYIPDHPYRMLIIDGSGSGKTIVLLNLIKHQQKDIDKNLFKHQISKKREKVGIKRIQHPKTFTDYSQNIDNDYETLEDSNKEKESINSV